MDPCPFVRLTVESLALNLPLPTKPSPVLSGVQLLHPSTTPCFCKIHMPTFPSETALLPLCSSFTAGDESSAPDSTASAAAFHLDPAALRRLSGKPFPLRVSVFTGSMARTCGLATSAKLLGSVHVSIDLSGSLSRPVTFHGGWLRLGKKKKEEHGAGEPEHNKPSARVHLLVRSEPDPRFVFQFGGEPECSPVVFQIQENIRQPVFSCKFSADRNFRSR